MFSMFYGKTWSDMMERRLSAGQPAPQPQTEKEQPMLMSDIDKRVAENQRKLDTMTREFNARQASDERTDVERERQRRDCGGRDFLTMSKSYAAEHDVSLTAAMKVINRRYPLLYRESKPTIPTNS